MMTGPLIPRLLLTLLVWADYAACKSHSVCWVNVFIQPPFQVLELTLRLAPAGLGAEIVPSLARPRYRPRWSSQTLPTPVQIIASLNSPQITQFECALCFLHLLSSPV